MRDPFEFFTDSAGEHRFRVVAANGETIAQSEGYATAAGAREGAEALRRALSPGLADLRDEGTRTEVPHDGLPGGGHA